MLRSPVSVLRMTTAPPPTRSRLPASACFPLSLVDLALSQQLVPGKVEVGLVPCSHLQPRV